MSWELTSVLGRMKCTWILSLICHEVSWAWDLLNQKGQIRLTSCCELRESLGVLLGRKADSDCFSNSFSRRNTIHCKRQQSAVQYVLSLVSRQIKLNFSVGCINPTFNTVLYNVKQSNHILLHVLKSPVAQELQCETAVDAVSCRAQVPEYLPYLFGFS